MSVKRITDAEQTNRQSCEFFIVRNPLGTESRQIRPLYFRLFQHFLIYFHSAHDRSAVASRSRIHLFFFDRCQNSSDPGYQNRQSGKQFKHCLAQSFSVFLSSAFATYTASIGAFAAASSTMRCNTFLRVRHLSTTTSSPAVSMCTIGRMPEYCLLKRLRRLYGRLSADNLKY
mgnify:CR=1 FL=1